MAILPDVFLKWSFFGVFFLNLAKINLINIRKSNIVFSSYTQILCVFLHKVGEKNTDV